MGEKKASRGRARAFGILTWILLCVPACTVTSPYWGYEPESTSAAIPFQAFATSTANPIVIECAKDTSAHGWPLDGEASYVHVTNLSVSSSPLLDSTGATIYSASGNVALPSQCWDYFGSYDFWQANVRLSQVVNDPFSGGTTKRIYTSHDLAGLECLGRENGKAGTWFGFLGKGCEKIYSNSSDVIPYIVLRIDGYANGLSATAAEANIAGPTRVKLPASNIFQKEAPSVQGVEALSPELAREIKARGLQ